MKDISETRHAITTAILIQLVKSDDIGTPPDYLFTSLTSLCQVLVVTTHSLTPLPPASWSKELSLLQFGALPVPGCAFLQYSMGRRRMYCN